MQTIIVIPTYNEADNLPALAAELWAQEIPDLRLMVVDDASPDGTGDVAEELAGRRPGEIIVIRRDGKHGLGSAYVQGFRTALDVGADAIVQMDADFSHAPSFVPVLLDLLKVCDVAVGSRYVSGGAVDERWGVGRYLLSWWANSVYTRLILGINVKDATAGFKAWRRSTLLGLNLDNIRSQGYDFQVEMAYVTEKLGYRVCEHPIYFEDRRIGQSKMTVPVKLEAAWRVWEIRWRHRHLTPHHRRTITGVPTS
jgi:dolichol-phosphate mannosyltransferase